MSQAEFCSKHNRIFDASDEIDNGLCPECRAEAKADPSPTFYLRTYERGNVGNPCHYCGEDRPQHGEDLRCPPRAPKSESPSSRSGAAAEGSKSSSPIPSGGGEVESLRARLEAFEDAVRAEVDAGYLHSIESDEYKQAAARLAAARARIRELEGVDQAARHYFQAFDTHQPGHEIRAAWSALRDRVLGPKAEGEGR